MTEASIQEQDTLVYSINPSEPIEKWLSREYLLTNGTGSYSSGTIIGVNTRRYHGLLIAAAKPPLGRTNMLAGLGETLTIAGQSFELFNWEYRLDGRAGKCVRGQLEPQSGRQQRICVENENPAGLQMALS